VKREARVGQQLAGVVPNLFPLVVSLIRDCLMVLCP